MSTWSGTHTQSVRGTTFTGTSTFRPGVLHKSINPPGPNLSPDVVSLVTQPALTYSTGSMEVDSLRESVVHHAGRSGFRALVQTLRAMDKNGNTALTQQEFKGGLKTFGLGLGEDDMEAITRRCSAGGRVAVSDFVQTVRGPMSSRRTDLVVLVYDMLDQHCDGKVTYDAIKRAYDVHRHPQVLSGEFTTQQALMDFMKGWAKHGDNPITREEFIDFYADVGACIDDDTYFEYMLRQVWHLPEDLNSGTTTMGGSTKVLVIHNNGTQTIELLQHDAGIRPADTQKIIARLRQQGINDAKSVSIVP